MYKLAVTAANSGKVGNDKGAASHISGPLSLESRGQASSPQAGPAAPSTCHQPRELSTAQCSHHRASESIQANEMQVPSEPNGGVVDCLNIWDFWLIVTMQREMSQK